MVDSDGPVLELGPGASPGHNKLQSKKSLPHKKRISRKLKKNNGNITPQQVTTVTDQGSEYLLLVTMRVCDLVLVYNGMIKNSHCSICKVIINELSCVQELVVISCTDVHGRIRCGSHAPEEEILPDAYAAHDTHDAHDAHDPHHAHHAHDPHHSHDPHDPHDQMSATHHITHEVLKGYKSSFIPIKRTRTLIF